MLISFPSFEYSTHMADLSLLGKTLCYTLKLLLVATYLKFDILSVSLVTKYCRIRRLFRKISWDAHMLKIFEAPSQELLFYLLKVSCPRNKDTQAKHNHIVTSGCSQKNEIGAIDINSIYVYKGVPTLSLSLLENWKTQKS